MSAITPPSGPPANDIPAGDVLLSIRDLQPPSLHRTGTMRIMRALIVAGAVAAALSYSEGVPAQLNATSNPTKGIAMSTVTFGKHSKITAQPADKTAIRKFYREVLGVPQARESENVDIFRLGPQFFLGVVYDKNAPTAAAMQESIWLELATADPAAMKARILAGGGKEIEYRDKNHLYFQAPGGQVFRLISDTEDMSAWER